MDDLVWLEMTFGERDAAALWHAVEDAERMRLIRVFGYPKDNAIPPPLHSRLRDPIFNHDLDRVLSESVGDHLDAARLRKKLNDWTRINA